MEDTIPWERRAGESAKAFEGFVAYRDLGPARTLTAAAARLGKHRSVLAEWSMRHSWVIRAEAYDAEDDRVRRGAHLATVQAMGERQAIASQAAQEAAMAPIRAVLERLRADREAGRSDFLDGLLAGTPAEAVELALQAARSLPALQAAERLARGEPTEIIRTASVAVEVRSPAELASVLEALMVVGVLALPEMVDPEFVEVEPEVVETV